MRPLMINCPGCQKPAVYDIRNEYRPFCSHHCKIFDIAAWADEKHRIPDPTPLGDTLDSEEMQ